jgi:hypothetical protein
LTDSTSCRASVCASRYIYATIPLLHWRSVGRKKF